MLAPNDARVTALRCHDPATGSAAGVIAAGDPLEIVMSVEAGTTLFATGARFAAGIEVGGAPAARVEGWLGQPAWPLPASELRLRVPGAITAPLADRLLGVIGFLRMNAAPPFLVSTLRGPEAFVVPAVMTPGHPLHDRSAAASSRR